MKSKEKTIKYPSPSGYATLYNYKEPLSKVVGGHGFLGVLLHDNASSKVQCHVCGGWFKSLGQHAHLHKLNAAKYKKKFGLMNTTALISENLRKTQIKIAFERWANYTPKQKAYHIQRAKDNVKTMTGVRRGSRLGKRALEHKNNRGTCPSQLLDRLRKKAIELGRTPARTEISFSSTIFTTFGSYRKACELAGLIPNALNKPPDTKIKYTAEMLVGILKNFVAEYGRLPSNSDFRRHLLPSRIVFDARFGGMIPAYEAAKLPQPLIDARKKGMYSGKKSILTNTRRKRC